MFLDDIVSPLNELSKDQLKNYIRANAADAVQRTSSDSFKSGAAGDQYNKSAFDTPVDRKRERGMDRALNKLAREDAFHSDEVGNSWSDGQGQWSSGDNQISSGNNPMGFGEGYQDFNKVEPYEVCLAGKCVKTFDYYEDARRFHDNWKKKLYSQGEQAKADKITLNPVMKEQGVAEGEGGLGQTAGIGINGKQFNFSIKDLIAKAQNYPVKKLNPQLFVKQLADRHEDPKQTAARAQAADLQYPIIVVQDGNTLMIADGTHRAQKAIMNKLPSINARVIPVKDMDEFSQQGVAEGAGNNLQTIIKSFVDSPSGQKYKKYDCKTITRVFVHWAEQNKIPAQVISLAPPSAEFIKKNPQFKGKSGQGDGHIMPVVDGNAIDFTVRQFGINRPFENPLVTSTNSLPAVYGRFGYFTDKPEWFLGGKSHWMGPLSSIPNKIFNQNFSDEMLEQGVAEGSENNNPIANKIFFARSNKAPEGWSYDHVGFITQDGKQIQMSGHKGNDVYVTNDVTDDPEFPKQNIKIVSLSKPVSVPTTNSVGAENCGTFVANVLQANGIKGIDTQKIYSVFKKPQEQGVAEMDKSQRPPSRHGDYALGAKGTTVKPATPKKVVKDLTKVLDKAFDRTAEPEPSGVYKKNEFDIKEAGSPAQQAAIAIAMKKASKKPEQVDELSVDTLKSYADKRGAQVAAMRADNPEPAPGSPEWVQQAVPAQQVNLAKRKIARKERQAGVAEGGYSRYDNNRTGFGKRPREDDEYHVPDPVETEYNIKVNGQVINDKPFANRAAAVTWAKQAVADGKLDPKNAKLSPINQVSEISNDKLAQYKTAAGADASAADKRGDYERGNKRFKGIVKATIKQGENDLDRTKQPEPSGVYKKNEFDIGEGLSVASSKDYQQVPSYKNYNIYVSKKPFGNTGRHIAYSQIGRDEIKDNGPSREEAVQAIRDKIDFLLNAQKKVTGSSTIDFNVKFATDILHDPKQTFYAKLENIEGQSKLVIAGDQILAEPEFIKELGFKKSSLRKRPDEEGRSTPLPGVPLTAKGLRAGDWIANGRYLVGNEHQDEYGNRVFDLTYHSTAHTKSDKMRISQPAFTLGTNREVDEGAMKDAYTDNQDAVYSALTRRVLGTPAGHFLIKTYGLDRVMDAMQEVADFHGDVEEIGSSDVSAYMRQLQRTLESNR